MQQEKIDRINELSRLSKERSLTDSEKAEQSSLRAEYIADWRKGTQKTLDNTYVIGPDGVKRKLQRKGPGH